MQSPELLGRWAQSVLCTVIAVIVHPMLWKFLTPVRVLWGPPEQSFMSLECLSMEPPTPTQGTSR